MTAELTPDDLYLFGEGTHRRLHGFLGAHVIDDGVRFAVWAPNAERVSVVGCGVDDTVPDCSAKDFGTGKLVSVIRSSDVKSSRLLVDAELGTPSARKDEHPSQLPRPDGEGCAAVREAHRRRENRPHAGGDRTQRPAGHLRLVDRDRKGRLGPLEGQLTV